MRHLRYVMSPNLEGHCACHRPWRKRTLLSPLNSTVKFNIMDNYNTRNSAIAVATDLRGVVRFLNRPASYIG